MTAQATNEEDIVGFDDKNLVNSGRRNVKGSTVSNEELRRSGNQNNRRSFEENSLDEGQQVIQQVNKAP